MTDIHPERRRSGFPRSQDERDAFIEDYEFLVSTGETHPERLAARLGVPSPAALEKQLGRDYGQYVRPGTLPSSRQEARCA